MKLRRALRLLLALGTGWAGAAQAADGCVGRDSPFRLYVDVGQVRSSRGLIAVTIYGDDSRVFLKHAGAVDVGRVAAVAPSTRVCIHLPSAGVYAVAVYHDENGNRRFDRNAIGLPAEAYGFSNNPATFFGLPSFHSVRLSVPRSDLAIAIKLHYP